MSPTASCTSSSSRTTLLWASCPSRVRCAAAALGLHTAAPACLIAALTQQSWRAGALHSLQRLAATCDLVVVTSRQHCIRGPTLEWIERHFPGVFAEVHFGNHWALEGQSKAKSEICRRASSQQAQA